MLEETEAANLGLVLRVPVLYGTAEEPKESAINVLMDSVWKAQDEDAKITMDDWAQRYPTNTEDVGRVCFDLGTRYLAAGDTRSNMPRVLHFSSEDKFTKFEICRLFADIMDLPLEGMQADKDGGGPNASIRRPYDTHLSSQALRDLGINTQTQDFNAWWYVICNLLIMTS